MRPLHSLVGAAILSIGAVALFAAGGCNVGNLGERCNPDLSHDECGAGLVCTQPALCPENYCCPPPPAPGQPAPANQNPYCMTGCNGGQASICAAGGDADCEGGAEEEAGADAGAAGDAADGGG
jgi:hypothetical protein